MPRQFQVTLPAGTRPGQTAEVTAPDGQIIRFTVPPGHVPGQVIILNYEPAQQPVAQTRRPSQNSSGGSPPERSLRRPSQDSSGDARPRRPSADGKRPRRPSSDGRKPQGLRDLLKALDEGDPQEAVRDFFKSYQKADNTGRRSTPEGGYERPTPEEQPPQQHNMRIQQPTRAPRRAARNSFRPEKSKPPTCCGCGYICIKPDELMALERCGSYKGVRNSGFHILGCDWFGKTLHVQKVTTRITETEMESATKTKDNVFVNLTVAVQIEVAPEQAFEAIYKLEDPIGQIESYVADVVRGAVPKLTLDELFASKDDIVAAVKHRLDDNLHAFGFRILEVLITDLVPDYTVKVAMNSIDVNRRLRTAAEEKAEAAKIMVVTNAEAESESMYLQGQGIARHRTAIVDGLKRDVGGGAEIDPKTVTNLVLITTYFDTLSSMAESHNSTIYMPHSVSNLSEICREVENGIFRESPTTRQRALKMPVAPSKGKGGKVTDSI